MKTSMYESEVDVLFPNSNMNVFRLSVNFEYLAIVLSKYLTLFHFKKNLTLSIGLDGDPVQIEFLGKSIMGVRFANKKVVFYRITTECAIQMQRIEFTAVSSCDMMLFDQIDGRIFLLQETKLYVYEADGEVKIPMLVKSVNLQNARITLNTEWCLAKGDSSAPDSIYIMNTDRVERFLIKYDDDRTEEKAQVIETKLKDLIAIYWSQKGYAVLINNRLEADLICYGSSKGLSFQIQDRVTSKQPFTNDCLQFQSVDNVKDTLVIYCQQQSELCLFELDSLKKKNESSIQFISRLRIVKLQETITKFDVTCDVSSEVILYVNETGLKNLKIRRQNILVQKEPEVKPAQFKPKKVKQKESKVLKHVTQPTVPSETLTKSTEVKQTTTQPQSKEQNLHNISVSSDRSETKEPKSVFLQPLKKEEPRKGKQKKVTSSQSLQPNSVKAKNSSQPAQPVITPASLKTQTASVVTPSLEPSSTNTTIKTPDLPVEKSKQSLQHSQTTQPKSSIKEQPKSEIKELPKLSQKDQPNFLKDKSKDPQKSPKAQKFSEQYVQNESEFDVQQYFTKIQNLFNTQLTSFEAKMKGVVTVQMNRITQEITKTGNQLSDDITSNVTKNTKQSLLKHMQEDLQGKIETYFQQIFKKIGETHQLGINYFNEQQRLQKEKFQKLNNQGVLANLGKIEAVLAQIKSEGENGTVKTLEKTMSDITDKMSDLSRIIQLTLEKQNSLADFDASKGDQIIQKLSQIFKLIGKEQESKTLKKKKFLLIRRAT